MPIPLGVLAVAGAGAAGGGGAFDLLETTVLGSDAASVTFSSLGSYSAYKHLQIRMVSRCTRAATIADTFVQVNGDTGNNYAYHRMLGSGSSVGEASSINRANAFLAYTSAANATANNFATTVFDILDFSSTSKTTTFRSLTGMVNTSGNLIGLFSGLWNNTAAVTSINIFPEAGNFLTGSRFSLYGYK
jgi:hypothetical protein